MCISNSSPVKLLLPVWNPHRKGARPPWSWPSSVLQFCDHRKCHCLPRFLSLSIQESVLLYWFIIKFRVVISFFAYSTIWEVEQLANVSRFIRCLGSNLTWGPDSYCFVFFHHSLFHQWSVPGFWSNLDTALQTYSFTECIYYFLVLLLGSYTWLCIWLLRVL